MFGDRPVIAAGSTGSIPATADLLRAIARLPRGALVLPGLDTSLDAETLRGAAEARGPAARPSAVRPRAAGAGARRRAPVSSRSSRPARARAPPCSTARSRSPRTPPRWAAERDALAAEMPTAARGPHPPRRAHRGRRGPRHRARGPRRGRQQAQPSASSRPTAISRAASRPSSAASASRSTTPPARRSSSRAAGRLARQVLAVAASDFAPVDTIALLRNRAVTARPRAQRGPAASPMRSTTICAASC